MAEGLENKLAYFQAITGLDDPDLCTEILSAHNWDLELAISDFTSSSINPYPNSSSSAPAAVGGFGDGVGGGGPNLAESSLARHDSGEPDPPGLAWKLITLPLYVVSGGIGLITGAVGLGVWIAGGIVSRSLNLLGLAAPRGPEADRLVPLSASAAEAAEFVAAFERDFGAAGAGVRFVVEGFMDALQRSQREYKLLFVYLHSPDHPDVPAFCSGCLCSAPVAAFVNENFVAWGGSIRRTEGFKMSNSLKAFRFPFCAVVVPSTNQRIVLLQQIEGPMSSEEMLAILQRVVEECTQSLVAARLEAEERRNNQRLREEQDAAYRAALEADQARERQRKEEQERLEREAAEAERKRKEEEETRERAACEAAEKEAALARRRQEKAMSLGVEPEKGLDVTQVLVRFPSGERKERKFHSSATVSSLYDYVDSLDCLKAEKYTMVSNFPRISYGPEKHSLTLKEAGKTVVDGCPPIPGLSLSLHDFWTRPPAL
ncbi:plant UBX domain-containing protein 10-like isoform X2 [Phoenix dactylifera]|uniref:Plant UBX domain-containing protein 10-like isoform X2 n=1 Tax=Phoenix dactylifera TaxID=42345 RepID=A0A8B8ZWP6_PHODC|nr:plant UBX domain-containing protein 10-like isoform X2 [Phoenix dactylifera]XP_038977782.1 plant UBX domain-containing protein 10-like isoform X2 [Phoenix dactylifera]